MNAARSAPAYLLVTFVVSFVVETVAPGGTDPGWAGHADEDDHGFGGTVLVVQVSR